MSKLTIGGASIAPGRRRAIDISVARLHDFAEQSMTVEVLWQGSGMVRQCPSVRELIRGRGKDCAGSGHVSIAPTSEAALTHRRRANDLPMMAAHIDLT